MSKIQLFFDVSEILHEKRSTLHSFKIEKVMHNELSFTA